MAPVRRRKSNVWNANERPLLVRCQWQRWQSPFVLMRASNSVPMNFNNNSTIELWIYMRGVSHGEIMRQDLELNKWIDRILLCPTTIESRLFPKLKRAAVRCQIKMEKCTFQRLQNQFNFISNSREFDFWRRPKERKEKWVHWWWRWRRRRMKAVKFT